MSKNKKPFVHFEQDGPITVGTIAASSVLDALNVTEFEQTVLKHVRGKPGINLLLNFENVNYLSSAVLSTLIIVKDAALKDTGDVRLCGLQENIQEVFRITNLDQVFVIYASAKDAAKRFERSLNIAAQEESWQRFSKEEE